MKCLFNIVDTETGRVGECRDCRSRGRSGEDLLRIARREVRRSCFEAARRAIGGAA